MTNNSQIFLPPIEGLTPEADRFGDWPHPREMLKIFGHDAPSGPEAELIGAFDNKNMHHAWIFSGAEGIGKATMAYRFARYVLANAELRASSSPTDIMSDGALASNRQIASMSNPGLMTIRRVWNEKTKKNSTIIPVDEVRRLKSFLHHTSAGKDLWRVIIVDRADDLNINAANALLKSLEEPPKNCLFLLVSSDPGRLLPTIRSRCRMLEFSPLNNQHMQQAVSSLMGSTNKTTEDRLINLADGRVRRYLALAAGDGIKYYDLLLVLLSSMPALDEGKLLKLSDDLSAPTALAAFDMFYDLFFSILARIIHASATGEDLLDQERKACGHLVSNTALAQWAGLWETIAAEKADVIRLNLDRKSFVLETFYRMKNLSRRVA